MNKPWKQAAPLAALVLFSAFGAIGCCGGDDEEPPPAADPSQTTSTGTARTSALAPLPAAPPGVKLPQPVPSDEERLRLLNDSGNTGTTGTQP